MTKKIALFSAFIAFQKVEKVERDHLIWKQSIRKLCTNSEAAQEEKGNTAGSDRTPKQNAGHEPQC